MEYFLKEYKLSEFWWFNNNIYMMNNILFYNTLWAAYNYNDISSHTLSQIYRQYPCSLLLLFVVLFETRYYWYNYFFY